MTARLYSSLIEPTTLTAAITNSSSSLSLSVASSTNFPSAPFTLVLDPDTANEEVVTVVSGTSSPYTITRNAEGGGLKNHAPGAVVKHMITARDLQEPQKHIEATTAYTINNPKDDPSVTGATITKPLHGIASGEGSVVGTDKPQTLTAKTMSGSNNTFSNIPSSAISGNFTQDRITDLVTNLAAKASIASPIFTGTVTIPTGASITAPVLSGTTNATSGTIALGTNATAITANGLTISAAEVGYLDGVTSAIQTQLNAKLTSTLTGTITNNGTITGGNINGATIDSASTIGGVSGTTLAADRTSWTTYNPVISGTNWTQGAIVTTGEYKQIGKIVFFKGSVTFPSPSSTGGATIGTGSMTVSLPVTASDTEWTGTGRCALSVLAPSGYIVTAPSSTTTFIPQLLNTSGTYASRSGISSSNYGSTFVANDVIYFSGTYEAA